MRIGTKKLSYSIELKPKYQWHTGVATLCIWKMHFDDEVSHIDDCTGWVTNDWWFIPIFGKTIYKNK